MRPSRDRKAQPSCATLRTTASPSVPITSSQTVNSRMAIFTKKGKQFDTTGRVLYGPVEHQQRVQGIRRPVRGAEQRRRRRALRPARRSLADRDADLPARSGRVPISRPSGRPALPRTSVRRASPVSRGAAAPLFQPPPPDPAAAPPAQPVAAVRPPAAVRHLARRDRTRCATRSAPARSVRAVLPL